MEARLIHLPEGGPQVAAGLQWPEGLPPEPVLERYWSVLSGAKVARLQPLPLVPGEGRAALHEELEEVQVEGLPAAKAGKPAGLQPVLSVVRGAGVVLRAMAGSLAQDALAKGRQLAGAAQALLACQPVQAMAAQRFRPGKLREEPVA